MVRDYLTGSSPLDDATVITYEDDSGDISLDIEDFDVEKSSDDEIHTVIEGQTLQNIAYQYYGDSGLWYLIALANDIMNPFSDELYAGQQLRIPNYG